MKNDDLFLANHLKSQAAILEAYQKQVNAQISHQIQRINTPYKPQTDITSLLEKPKASEYASQLAPGLLQKLTHRAD